MVRIVVQIGVVVVNCLVVFGVHLGIRYENAQMHIPGVKLEQVVINEHLYIVWQNIFKSL